ncbi:hypothetical protein [Prochlorococcus marinus]|nr:hypothetical protein [Prochlorococcus marinus]
MSVTCILVYLGGQTFKETYMVKDLQSAKKTAENETPPPSLLLNQFFSSPYATYTTKKSA